MQFHGPGISALCPRSVHSANPLLSPCLLRLPPPFPRRYLLVTALRLLTLPIPPSAQAAQPLPAFVPGGLLVLHSRSTRRPPHPRCCGRRRRRRHPTSLSCPLLSRHLPHLPSPHLLCTLPLAFSRPGRFSRFLAIARKGVTLMPVTPSHSPFLVLLEGQPSASSHFPFSHHRRSSTAAVTIRLLLPPIFHHQGSRYRCAVQEARGSSSFLSTSCVPLTIVPFSRVSSQGRTIFALTEAQAAIESSHCRAWGFEPTAKCLTGHNL
ncbi:hypothetical protein EDB89DRAFT_2178841 [Lactarius sanguifluus]|nr:hypothetical protein EDB89DRAFT_2178841 [Lactarius sanguifluus]